MSSETTERETFDMRPCPRCGRIICGCTAAGGDADERRGLIARAEAAEAERDRLRERLAEADEIIDDCWHQFAIDIRGKLTPGGLSTLEMVDDYRNSRDAALAGDDT